tara:strand:+ start:416 stop:784 length:369 start_codon:yes stop_codon:yes gene_type:complete
MTKNKVLIHTQYQENYGYHEGSFHWKNKGSHTFEIEMEADLLMYSTPSKVFAKMLKSHNSDLEKFIYVDHEIQFQKPTSLGNQDDYIKANESIENENHTNNIIGGVDFTQSIDQLNNLSIIK